MKRFLFVVYLISVISSLASAAVNVNLLWDAPSVAPAGYNIYRGTAAGGPYTKLNTAPVTATTFTDATAPNAVVYYAVRSVSAVGIESVTSNELKADLTVPAPPTNLRLGTITTVDLFINQTKVASGPPPLNYIIPRITPPQSFVVNVTGQ